MKVIIAGSRDINSEQVVKDAIGESGWSGLITEIVHGCARGVDTVAGRVCEGVWPINEFPAEWKKYGRSAGALRNTEMAKYADALIAIWDGKSRGTEHMIDTATRMGLKVYVHRAVVRVGETGGAT